MQFLFVGSLLAVTEASCPNRTAVVTRITFVVTAETIVEIEVSLNFWVHEVIFTQRNEVTNKSEHPLHVPDNPRI